MRAKPRSRASSWPSPSWAASASSSGRFCRSTACSRSSAMLRAVGFAMTRSLPRGGSAAFHDLEPGNAEGAGMQCDANAVVHLCLLVEPARHRYILRLSARAPRTETKVPVDMPAHLVDGTLLDDGRIDRWERSIER